MQILSGSKSIKFFEFLFQSCMLKVSKAGIVTRNCGPESGKSDGCELDVHGNKICHCLTDFCNSAISTGKANIKIWVALLIPLLLVLVIWKCFQLSAKFWSWAEACWEELFAFYPKNCLLAHCAEKAYALIKTTFSNDLYVSQNASDLSSELNILRINDSREIHFFWRKP